MSNPGRVSGPQGLARTLVPSERAAFGQTQAFLSDRREVGSEGWLPIPARERGRPTITPSERPAGIGAVLRETVNLGEIRCQTSVFTGNVPDRKMTDEGPSGARV